MRIGYDILSAQTDNPIVVDQDQATAAAWMVVSSNARSSDAHLALAVALPGDTVRCGHVKVRIHSMQASES